MLPFMIWVSMHMTELYQKLFCQIIIIFSLCQLESMEWNGCIITNAYWLFNVLDTIANWYDKWENKYFDRFPIKHLMSLINNFFVHCINVFNKKYFILDTPLQLPIPTNSLSSWWHYRNTALTSNSMWNRSDPKWRWMWEKILSKLILKRRTRANETLVYTIKQGNILIY